MQAKAPPADLEAEQAVLGAVFLDNSNIEKIVDNNLSAGDFYSLENRILAEGMLHLYNHGTPIDYITINDWIKGHEKYSKQFPRPPVTYCTEIAEKTLSSAFICDHIEIIKAKSILRNLISTCSQTIEQSFTVDKESLEEFLSQVDSQVGIVVTGGKPNSIPHISELAQKFLPQFENIVHNPQSVTGIRSGFVDLDKVLSGFQNSDLIILAARPSMGKSAYSLQIAYNVAKIGVGAVFFSLEMSSLQLFNRLITSEARIDSQKLRSGNLTDQEVDRVLAYYGKICEVPLYIEDRPLYDPLDLRIRLRKLVREKGVKIAIIDYLQLMHSPKYAQNRVLEIGDITRKTKLLAKELNIPIILLSQLNREVEKRVDKRPQLSDLRDSGSVEQDSDVVLFLYRDEVYNKLTTEQGIAEVIIGKNRNGPLPTIKLKWFEKYTRFDNLAYVGGGYSDEE